MMFKSIDPVIDRGVMKQLDFEDLLPLPLELHPSFCNDTLLNSWQIQLNHNNSAPSLFKSLCHAYGWTYFRLGFLKVVNLFHIILFDV